MLDINTLWTLPAGLHTLEAPPSACMGTRAHAGMRLCESVLAGGIVR